MPKKFLFQFSKHLFYNCSWSNTNDHSGSNFSACWDQKCPQSRKTTCVEGKRDTLNININARMPKWGTREWKYSKKTKWVKEGEKKAVREKESWERKWESGEKPREREEMKGACLSRSERRGTYGRKWEEKQCVWEWSMSVWVCVCVRVRDTPVCVGVCVSERGKGDRVRDWERSTLMSVCERKRGITIGWVLKRGILVFGWKREWERERKREREIKRVGRLRVFSHKCLCVFTPTERSTTPNLTERVSQPRASST